MELELLPRADFILELEAIGKTRKSHIYELDEPLIRAKGAKQICPRRSKQSLFDVTAGMGVWGQPLWIRSRVSSHARK